MEEERSFEEVYQSVENICKKYGLTFYRLKDSDSQTLWNKGVIYEGHSLLYEVEFDDSIWKGKKDVCGLNFIPKHFMTEEEAKRIYSKLEKELHEIYSLKKYVVNNN